jgi:hypothetical protein
MSYSAGDNSDPYLIALSREIAEGNCVIFVGSHVSETAGIPGWAKLEGIMREKIIITQDYCPPRVADCCRELLGTRLFNKLIESVIKPINHPTQLHRHLAKLPVNLFVTTNFDTLLERAIEEEKGSEVPKVLSLADDARWLHVSEHPEEIWVLKIHGCISRSPSNLVITEEDYLAFPLQYSTVIQSLGKNLADKSVLFVGYSIDDWDVMPLLHRVLHTITGYNNAYFVGVNIEPPMEGLLTSRYGLHVFNLEPLGGPNHTSEDEEFALLGFFDTIVNEFEIPDWFGRIIADTGYLRELHGLTTTTSLTSLFPGFDVTARIRLALKIEKARNVQLPLEKIVDPELTVGMLLGIVRAVEHGIL